MLALRDSLFTVAASSELCVLCGEPLYPGNVAPDSDDDFGGIAHERCPEDFREED